MWDLTPGLPTNNYCYHYTSDSLWKTWLVESIQSIHNSLWTWHDKCNICCRYYIYHIRFNVFLVNKPLGVFSSETKWLNASLLFLRMNYVKNYWIQLLHDIMNYQTLVSVLTQTSLPIIYNYPLKGRWIGVDIIYTETRSIEVYIHCSSPTLRGIVVLVFTKSDG